jgi:hypothetical protein
MSYIQPPSHRQMEVPVAVPMLVGDLAVIPIFDAVIQSQAEGFYRLRADEPEQRGFRAEDWVPHREQLDSAGWFEHAYGGF